MAAVSRSGSRACKSRRIIASEGRRSGAIPTARTVASGTSATHSAMAVYERYPATTAHTAAVTTTVSGCRTPRRERGSGTSASAAGSPPAVSGTVKASAQDRDEISDDGSAGITHFG
ncbi:hypothetical protein KRMM14A1259_39830 [Krasilnikovia sp. MM14-A1259]